MHLKIAALAALLLLAWLPTGASTENDTLANDSNYIVVAVVELTTEHPFARVPIPLCPSIGEDDFLAMVNEAREANSLPTFTESPDLNQRICSALSLEDVQGLIGALIEEETDKCQISVEKVIGEPQQGYPVSKPTNRTGYVNLGTYREVEFSANNTPRQVADHFGGTAYQNFTELGFCLNSTMVRAIFFSPPC